MTTPICAGKRCVGLNTPATFEHGSYPVCDDCAFASARAEPETDRPTRLPHDDLVALLRETIKSFALREFSRLSHARRCQFVQKKGTSYVTLCKRLPEPVIAEMLTLAEEWVLKGMTP